MKNPQYIFFIIVFLVAVVVFIVSCVADNITNNEDAEYAHKDVENPLQYRLFGHGANLNIVNPKTIEVTNLNNSGSGSLRDALNQSGDRIIIVTTKGVINLQSNIYVTNGDFILYGNAIKTSGGMIQLEASNIFFSDIEITNPLNGYDCLSVTAWSGKYVENIVLDHLNLSYASDENLDLRGNGYIKNITVQHCKITDNHYGMLIAGKVENVSILNNHFVNNDERNVRIRNFSENAFSAELINNVFEGFRSATRVTLGSKFTIVNNTFIPRENNPSNIIISGENDNLSEVDIDWTYGYIQGNTIPEGFSLINDVLDKYLHEQPFLPLTITPKTTYADWVVQNAGTIKQDIL